MTTITVGELAEGVATWNPQRHPDKVFDYIDLSGIDNEAKAVISTTRTTGADAPSRARQIVATGDVLVSTVRPNLNAVAMVPSSLDGATVSTGFSVLRPLPGVEGRFLFHWVRSPAFVADMVRRATGASYPAVSDRIVRESPLPKLRFDEQRRIAAILDHADALRAKRRQVFTHLRELTAAAFRERFGPSSWMAVTTKPLSAAKSVHPWVSLSSVARLATGHTPSRDNPEYWEGDIPWIALPDIRALDGQVTFDTALHVTEAGIKNSSAFVLPRGTVCFSRTASLGFVTTMGAPMSTSQDFHNWVPGPEIDSTYLREALRISRAHLIASSDGSTHRTIYQRTAETFHVLLPPLDEQLAYADTVAAIQAQTERNMQVLLEAQELFSSLQARAFGGQL